MGLDVLHQLCLERGFFLRREALGFGVGDGALRRAVRAGALVKLRHGAYTFTSLWDPMPPLHRHRVTAQAVVMANHDQVAVSHTSAVALHGIDGWRLPLEQVHVTRLDDGAGRTTDDVVQHVGTIDGHDLTDIRGMAVTRPVRAVLESATLLDAERALIVLDSGLRAGLFTSAELDEQAAVMNSWPGSLRLPVVTKLADGRSGSVGESRCRHLFWRCGVPAPRLQYEVHDEHGLAGISDFAWPEHELLGEFDGKIKYGALLRDGESPSDVVFREKQREDRMRRATGFRVVRITWDMLLMPLRTAAYVRSMMGIAA